MATSRILPVGWRLWTVEIGGLMSDFLFICSHCHPCNSTALENEGAALVLSGEEINQKEMETWS